MTDEQAQKFLQSMAGKDLQAQHDAALARSVEAYNRLTAKCEMAQAKAADLAARRAKAWWAMTSDDVAFLRACGIQP